MIAPATDFRPAHGHVFLGDGHEANERRTWLVIGLCGAMMVAEVVGGLSFGSLALVADGLHMSTHAGALLLAALAYRYARRHAHDERFTFGTGKLGDLAGFTSAIVLAMIALLIAYEAFDRLLHPVAIRFSEAIPIAALGLGVNIASVWMLGAGDHHHGHGHSHHDHRHEDTHSDVDEHILVTEAGTAHLAIFEQKTPARFRVRWTDTNKVPFAHIETERPDGALRIFALEDRGGYLESVDVIPEPHAFIARLHVGGGSHSATFDEPEHTHSDGVTHADNNMRAALAHVIADAAVSVLVIAGLILARLFGWVWMDPIAGLIGAGVIASWSFGLVRDTGAILLDMTTDRDLANTLRKGVEAHGDEVSDLHVWRVGPGHLAAIVGVRSNTGRTCDDYRLLFSGTRGLSHLTVDVAQGR